MPPPARSKALIDLILAVGVVLVSLPWASPTHSPVSAHEWPHGVLMLAAFQFTAEGLVPLLLIAIHRERLSGFGCLRYP